MYACAPSTLKFASNVFNTFFGHRKNPSNVKLLFEPSYFFHYKSERLIEFRNGVDSVNLTHVTYRLSTSRR